MDNAGQTVRGRLFALDSVTKVEGLQANTSYALFCFFLFQASAVVAASLWVWGEAFVIALPLVIIAAVTAFHVYRNPSKLSTRYVVTIALHSTWMFGLVIAADVNGGAHMLEVHMLYFINSLFVVGYACWRTAVFSTAIVIIHHFVLTAAAPNLVWDINDQSWIHFGVHAFLGIFNVAGGGILAVALQNMMDHLDETSIHDDLTGLLNRRGLRRAISARLDQDGIVHVLHADLDGFKLINDTAGHGVGDAVIKTFARQLAQHSPPGASVARLGGDEFVVVTLGQPENRIVETARDLLTWLKAPVELEQRRIRFGVSFGLTSTQISSRDTNALLLDADVALYAAKEMGGGQLRVYDKALGELTKSNLELSDDLLRGLDFDEFIPYFQTQHDAKTGAVVGVEALARWDHPTRGILTPADFLIAAEHSGKLDAIDARILDKSVAAIVTLEEENIPVGKVSVNISFARLRDPTLLQSARNAATMRTQLCFEIVEAVFLDGINVADRKTIDDLRELGVEVEIDDFGTGHASIVALTRLRPDRLKIDKELIDPIVENPSQASLVRVIVEMARALNIEVIAEGAETADQVHILRDMGVGTVQGYFYSKPIALADLRAFLKDQEGPHETHEVA